MSLLPGLFGPAIATAEALPPFGAEGLLPLEASAMARAHPRRQAEFATGRVLARRAMQALGMAPLPIPAGADRAPQWPAGLIGSISHSPRLCGVALARAGHKVRMLGLDIEEAEPLPAELFDTVLLADERARLSALGAEDAGWMARIVFSAKECCYKAQYPVTRTLFGFEVFDIRAEPAAGTFTATWQADIGPFRAGTVWAGRLCVTAGHVVTAITL